MTNENKPSKIRKMRKRFEAQLRIGSTPISEIRIPLKSRDEYICISGLFVRWQKNEMQIKTI